MIVAQKPDQVRWLAQLYHNNDLLTVRTDPTAPFPLGQRLALKLPYSNAVPTAEEMMGLENEDGIADLDRYLEQDEEMEAQLQAEEHQEKSEALEELEDSDVFEEQPTSHSTSQQSNKK